HRTERCQAHDVAAGAVRAGGPTGIAEGVGARVGRQRRAPSFGWFGNRTGNSEVPETVRNNRPLVPSRCLNTRLSAAGGREFRRLCDRGRAAERKGDGEATPFCGMGAIG
ncbi:hypothetical protein, partial [Methylobacterium sp. WL8]|uniref:hypothetical protein n=1 Tax=Methylobacterium sp. WL8 TaxID=2603899 RepID=UPI001AEEBC8D